MTREAIGSFLGLKIETLSRALPRLQEDGLIKVQQKHVQILDAKRLRAAMGCRQTRPIDSRVRHESVLSVPCLRRRPCRLGVPL